MGETRPQWTPCTIKYFNVLFGDALNPLLRGYAVGKQPSNSVLVEFERELGVCTPE
jgi:hypothetical protein